jgi:hypothetical protein
VRQSGRSLKSPTLTGGPKLAPPSVDFTSSIWLRLSSPVTALLKFWKTTYRSPLGAVNGWANWLASQTPAGPPLRLTGHSAGELPLMTPVWFQVAPWSSDQAKVIGEAVKSALNSDQAT